MNLYRPADAFVDPRTNEIFVADAKGNLYATEVNPGTRVQKFVFSGFKAP